MVFAVALAFVGVLALDKLARGFEFSREFADERSGLMKESALKSVHNLRITLFSG